MFRYTCFLLIWLSLLGIASAGELPAWVDEVSVTPADAQGFATLTLGGVWQNTCVPSSITHEVDGAEIQLDVAQAGINTICGQAFTDWSLQHRIGPLEDGTYSIFGSLYQFDPRDPETRRLKFESHLLVEGYEVVLPPAPAEDLTGDRFVDFADLTLLLAHWNLPAATAAQGNLVLPEETSIDFADLTALLSAWTGSAPAAAAAHAEAGGAPVPEPSTFALAVLALLCASAGIRRRRISSRP